MVTITLGFNRLDMKIKAGDRIGIGSNKTTSLYCHVVHVGNEGITFNVINGAWTGLLRPDGVIKIGNELITNAPRGEVLYVFRPGEPYMHYNCALNYMDDELAKRFRIRTYVKCTWYVVMLKVNAFRQWLSDIISPTKNIKSKYDDWDDDIPF